jgi:hypothetical protein
VLSWPQGSKYDVSGIRAHLLYGRVHCSVRGLADHGKSRLALLYRADFDRTHLLHHTTMKLWTKSRANVQVLRAPIGRSLTHVQMQSPRAVLAQDGMRLPADEVAGSSRCGPIHLLCAVPS